MTIQEHITKIEYLEVPKPSTNVDIILPQAQCGMNFIANLFRATTLKEQVEVLDYAFNTWGGGSVLKTPDPKSQVFFTDAIEMEGLTWPEIKKLCVRGPVTPNRRYPPTSSLRRNIAIYILTWDVYKEWRSGYALSEKEKIKEEQINN